MPLSRTIANCIMVLEVIVMTFEAYTNPDFTIDKKILFFFITLLGTALCTFLIILIEKLVFRLDIGKNAPTSDSKKLFHRIQRLYEMIISGTSVMSFSVAYVVINHINTLYNAGQGHSDPSIVNFIKLWTEGKDFILLLLILISCVLNTILDSFLIPLKQLDKSEKATMRMLGMFYVIIILMYLNLIGDKSEYGPVMMYYFGLMVGRFVYFDASIGDFFANIKNVFINLPYLIMCLILTAFLCMFGFGQGYFLERNYYIVGIYYAHLFMLICVFILNIALLIFKKVACPNVPDEDSDINNDQTGNYYPQNNYNYQMNNNYSGNINNENNYYDNANYGRRNSYPSRGNTSQLNSNQANNRNISRSKTMPRNNSAPRPNASQSNNQPRNSYHQSNNQTRNNVPQNNIHR